MPTKMKGRGETDARVAFGKLVDELVQTNVSSGIMGISKASNFLQMTKFSWSASPDDVSYQRHGFVGMESDRLDQGQRVRYRDAEGAINVNLCKRSQETLSSLLKAGEAVTDDVQKMLARWAKHAAKLHDPCSEVARAAGRRVRLSTLLKINGHAGKAGAGCDAPGLWMGGRLAQLEAYCMRDVDALCELVTRSSAVSYTHLTLPTKA